MKHKYILENYDRIVNEIKNPPIIFSNDLAPFLKKKSLESYFIYKIDFRIINNEVKYTEKNHSIIYILNVEKSNSNLLELLLHWTNTYQLYYKISI